VDLATIRTFFVQNLRVCSFWRTFIRWALWLSQRSIASVSYGAQQNQAKTLENSNKM